MSSEAPSTEQTRTQVRQEIRAEIAAIAPLDAQEGDDQRSVLEWLDSGVEIWRIAKPATPPRHLIAYFAVLDRDRILLVDHRLSGRWLPGGGHVEVGEHPRTTVMRECQEELSIGARFLVPYALMISLTETVGLTAGHTDVSLWYALAGDWTAPVHFDHREFSDARWFPLADIPQDRVDPQLHRFLSKVRQARETSPRL